MSMILQHGELYEWFVMEKIIQMLKILEVNKHKNITILDVGSGVGAWTIGLADKFDTQTTIFAFDAFREYLDCLEFAIRMNEFPSDTRFVLYDAIISNQTTHAVPLFTSSGGYKSSWADNSFVGFRTKNLPTAPFVLVTSLDYLFVHGIFSCPVLMRFDIDVNEFEALLGAEKLILHCLPLLLISLPCRSLVEPVVKYLHWAGLQLAWLPSVECAYCYESDWMMSRFPNQRGSPYLLAYPPGLSVDLPALFPNFLYPIPDRVHFLEQTIRYDDIPIDSLNIRISYFIGDSEIDFFVRHVNETAMGRCERVGPIDSYRHVILIDQEKLAVVEERRNIDLSRIQLIRNSELASLADATFLEQLIPRRGFNTELPHEQPRIVQENGGGLLIWQYPSQFSKYLALLVRQNVSSYLEVGCRWGGTFVLTNEVLKRFRPMTRSVAVDVIDSPVQDYCALNEEAEFLRASSSSEQFREFIGGAHFDVIFIDGDHSYEGVRGDYQRCREHGSIFVFHDISSSVCSDVERFWNQLKVDERDQYDFYEFVDQYEEVWQDLHHKFLGIGVAIKKSQ